MKSDVYWQSVWLIMKVVELYYRKHKSQKEIASILQISESTVSRLIRRGQEEGFVRFEIPEGLCSCIDMGAMLERIYHLKQVIVAPYPERVPESRRGPDDESQELALKRAVALEGARYLQRVLKEGDILGVAWGGTIYHFVQFLNPCLHSETPFITLHGSIECCDKNFDVETLVMRMAMALGGKYYTLNHGGRLTGGETMKKMESIPSIHKVMELSKRLTIAVSGVGGPYPDSHSPLTQESYLNPEELEELRAKGVCADFLLRFLDSHGREIDSPLKDNTLAISLDMYKRTKLKIVLASGHQKAQSVRAVLRGGLADVLVIDEQLAMAILQLNMAEHVPF